MKVIVVGKTDSILNLNKVGVPIRGKIQAVLEIDTEEKKNEIIGLKKAGYLDILEVNTPEEKIPVLVSPPVPISIPVSTLESAPKADTSLETEAITLVPSPVTQPEAKKKGGRPKGSKNKKVKAQAQSEAQRCATAEARTQEMGSKVIIGMGDRNIETKMRKSFEGEIKESEATKDSIRAMEEIQNAEAKEKNKEDTKIDETKLDPSEQMGRQATVVQEGTQKKTSLAKSIIPEQEKIREVDPFIDNKDDVKDPSKDAFVDKTEDEDDDSFLKI